MFNWLKRKHHFGRYKIVKSLIKGKGTNLLDIGCGSPSDCMKEGSFLNYIGYGTGLDITPRKIKFPFILGNIESLPIKDKQYDVVTCIEVIEHTHNPSKALEEVHRVLKDNGTFVMTTPNNHIFFEMFWFFWERSFGKMWEDDHHSSFDRKTWIKKIKKSGLFRIKKLINYWGVNLIFLLEKK